MFENTAIYPFHKWVPIVNSFARVKISVTNLVLTSKEFLFSNEVTRLERLIYI